MLAAPADSAHATPGAHAQALAQATTTETLAKRRGFFTLLCSVVLDQAGRIALAGEVRIGEGRGPGRALVVGAAGQRRQTAGRRARLTHGRRCVAGRGAGVTIVEGAAGLRVRRAALAALCLDNAMRPIGHSKMRRGCGRKVALESPIHSLAKQ